MRQRKEEAARRHRRVEARQEASGNACLPGRELAAEDALTAKDSVWAEAAALCDAGPGVPLREARAMVYLDRLRGLNPWDRLTPAPAMIPMTATTATPAPLATTLTVTFVTVMTPAASPSTGTAKTKARAKATTAARTAADPADPARSAERRCPR